MKEGCNEARTDLFNLLDRGDVLAPQPSEERIKQGSHQG